MWTIKSPSFLYNMWMLLLHGDIFFYITSDKKKVAGDISFQEDLLHCEGEDYVKALLSLS